jgi:hypothetical protein
LVNTKEGFRINARPSDRPPLDDLDRIDWLFLRVFAGGQSQDRQSMRRRDFLGDLFALAQVSAGWPIAPRCPFFGVHTSK